MKKLIIYTLIATVGFFLGLAGAFYLLMYSFFYGIFLLVFVFSMVCAGGIMFPIFYHREMGDEPKTYSKAQVMNLLICIDQSANPKNYGFTKKQVEDLVIGEAHSMGLLEELKKVSPQIAELTKDLE